MHAQLPLRFGATLLMSLGIPTVLAPTVLAQAPVPGEKWRETTRMEVPGMPMQMPARTTEICVPVARRDEALAVPAQEDCKLQDIQRGPNRFAAKFSCSAGSGSMEMISEGPNKRHRTMKMRTADGMDMTMTTDSEKIGNCDAAEVERKMNKMKGDAMAQVAADEAKKCNEAVADARENPHRLRQHFDLLYGSSYMGQKYPPTCKDPAHVKALCAVLQTRAGFGPWSQSERYERRQNSETPPVAGAATMQTVPNDLQHAVQLCGLGKGNAGVEGLRGRLVNESEKAGDWGFFGSEAPDDRRDPIGKQHCAGRGYSAAKDPAYREFCAQWGLSFSSRAGGAGGGSSAGGGNAAGGANASGGGGAGNSSTTAADDTATPPSTTDKAKEAAKKAGKKLRGIFRND